MSFAVSRSTIPDTCRSSASTTKPLRFSVMTLPRISELCLLTLALLGEFGLGVRGGAVRLIAAALAGKMASAVAPRRWRVTRTVLRHKALHRCPSLNLRAVDGKQPVAVLREHHRHPNSIIHAKTDKPAIEQIVM